MPPSSKQNLRVSSHQALKFQHLDLEWNKDCYAVENFAQRLKRKNVPVPDIYFTLFEAASITPVIAFNSHAKSKERGAWIPFKI